MKILFVEDDQDDVFLLERACKMASVNETKEFLPNGKAAVDYLSQRSAERLEGALPKLIFLDLNMPLMGGLEVLRWLRQQPFLQHIPAIVLTTSENPRDLAEAYRLGANAYLVKPTSSNELAEMLSCAVQFWLRFNNPAPLIA